MAPPEKKKSAPDAPGVERVTIKKRTPKRARYRCAGNLIGTTTLVGGDVDTPNPPRMKDVAEMPLFGPTAEGKTVNEPNIHVTKDGVAVHGDYCMVDGYDCTVTGNHCVVNGDNCDIIGDHCVVRGQNAWVGGDDCIIAREAVAAKVTGTRCTVRGIVVKMKGSGWLDGGSIYKQTGGSTSWAMKVGGASMSFNNCQVASGSEGVNVGVFSSRRRTGVKNVAFAGVAGDNARNVVVTGRGNAVSLGGGNAVAISDGPGCDSSSDSDA